jgi:alkylhydroperoxidase family enzyme
MAWIRTVTDDEAEGLCCRLFEAARARAGRVAGIIRVMSIHAEVAEASMAFYVRLMKGASPLSRGQREMLATVTSRVNDCHY